MTYYYSLTCHRAHRRGTGKGCDDRCRLECCYLEFDPWARRYFCTDPARASMTEAKRGRARA
jgi:hypothetical protein